MHWYPRYMTDYARDTDHLSLVENGAYDRLLNYYYEKLKAPPLEETVLFRICRAFTPEEQEAVRSVIKQFFIKQADGWHQKRADEEIAKAKKKSEVKSKAARVRHGRTEVTNPEGRAEAGKAEGERGEHAHDPAHGPAHAVHMHNTRSADAPANGLHMHTQFRVQRSEITDHNTQLTDHSSEKSSAGARVTARQPRKRLCDDEFIAELQADEAYKNISVRLVYNKMLVHCRRNNKQPTQNRLIAWLNREDQPMGNGNGSYQTGTGPQRSSGSDYEFKSRTVVR